MSKRCCTCKVEKELSEFGNCRTNQDKLQRACKTCRRNADIEYTKRNRVLNSNCNILSMPKNVMKKCCKCNVNKHYTDFHICKSNRDGVQRACKPCRKLYADKNREQTNIRASKHYYDNRETHLKQAKKYREKNPEKVRLVKKLWVDNNREHVKSNTRKYRKKRLQEDVEYKITRNLRTRLYGALKGTIKSAPTLELLGCTPQHLKEHLEAQFTEGMTWDNYTIDGWHVDHIIPCASFDLTDPTQQRECFHYTNLQPLWAEDNLIKGAKVLS